MTEISSESSTDNSQGLTNAETVVDTTAAAEVQTTTPGAEQTAESPTATETGEKKPASLLDLVKSVTAEPAAEAASPATTEKPAAQTPADPANPNPEEQVDPTKPKAEGEAKPGEGEEKLPPFHTHPRWQEMIRERDSYREDAENFRSIATFMEVNNLSGDEANAALEVAAAVSRGDVKLALQLLTPTFERLQLMAGEILPSDIAEQVENGELSEAAARRLVQAQAEAERTKHLQERQRFAHERQQQTAQHQQVVAQQHQIMSAVGEWEANLAASDPDFATKKDFLLREIRVRNMETPARTPQEALAIANEAYQFVTQQLRGLRPQKPEVKPAPKSELSAPGARPVAKSLRDIVRNAGR